MSLLRHRRILAGLAVVVVLGPVGCRNPATVSVQPTTEEMRRCATTSAITGFENVPHYWPPGTFHEDEERDLFLQSWYGAQLCAMGVSSLEAPAGERALRWTWLRSFHPAIAITVITAGDGAMLTWIELRGAGGYEPGLIQLQGAREISARDLASIEALVAEIDFWSLPTTVDRGGLDGSQWIVEVVESDRRHVVDRWNGGELEPLGRRLLKIAGLRGQRVY